MRDARRPPAQVGAGVREAGRDVARRWSRRSRTRWSRSRGSSSRWSTTSLPAATTTATPAACSCCEQHGRVRVHRVAGRVAGREDRGRADAEVDRRRCSGSVRPCRVSTRCERDVDGEKNCAVHRRRGRVVLGDLDRHDAGAAGDALVAAGEGAAGRDAADVRAVVAVRRVRAVVAAAGRGRATLTPPRQEDVGDVAGLRDDPTGERVVLVVDTGVDDRDLVGAAVVLPSKLLPRTPAVLSRSESMTPVLEASVGLDLAVEDDRDDVRVVEQHVEPVVGDGVDGGRGGRELVDRPGAGAGEVTAQVGERVRRCRRAGPGRRTCRARPRGGPWCRSSRSRGRDRPRCSASVTSATRVASGADGSCECLCGSGWDDASTPGTSCPCDSAGSPRVGSAGLVLRSSAAEAARLAGLRRVHGAVVAGELGAVARLSVVTEAGSDCAALAASSRPVRRRGRRS